MSLIRHKCLCTKIRFAKISVGATENLIIAASLAKGKTILSNCAIEPEINDLINFLIENNFRPIVFDNRDSGLSSRLNNEYIGDDNETLTKFRLESPTL